MKRGLLAFFAAAILAVMLVSGCAQYGQEQAGQQSQPPAPPLPPAAQEQPQQHGQAQQQAPPPPPPAPSEVQGAAANTVEITAAGFGPDTLTIKAGDSVKFVNKDATEHWPASALHPTHAVYPEPGGCIGSKFDACKGLAQGESFTFVFNEKGSWKYHDHLNPALRGTVVVE